MNFRTLFAKLRYPTPEFGDTGDEMPLDKYTVDDADDRNAAHQRPDPPKMPPKRKGKK